MTRNGARSFALEVDRSPPRSVDCIRRSRRTSSLCTASTCGRRDCARVSTGMMEPKSACERSCLRPRKTSMNSKTSSRMVYRSDASGLSASRTRAYLSISQLVATTPCRSRRDRPSRRMRRRNGTGRRQRPGFCLQSCLGQVAADVFATEEARPGGVLIESSDQGVRNIADEYVGHRPPPRGIP